MDELVSILSCYCYSGVGEDAMVYASSLLCLTVPINIRASFVGAACTLGGVDAAQYRTLTSITSSILVSVWATFPHSFLNSDSLISVPFLNLNSCPCK